MEIPLTVKFRGMSDSPALETHIRKWADRLDALHDRIVRCDVVVDAPHRHRRQGGPFHVRVTLQLPGGDLAISRDPGADQAHEDPYVAVRDAFRALRRRLEDHVSHRLRREVKAHEAPQHGRISYLDVEGEWGYLESADARRVYFHRNSVVGGITRITLGDEVRFAEEAGDKGPQASTVTPVGNHGRHALGPAENAD